MGKHQHVAARNINTNHMSVNVPEAFQPLQIWFIVYRYSPFFTVWLSFTTENEKKNKCDCNMVG